MISETSYLNLLVSAANLTPWPTTQPHEVQTTSKQHLAVVCWDPGKP